MVKSFKEYLQETVLKLRGFGPKSASDSVKNFMNDYHKTTKEHPLDNKSRILNGTTVHASEDGNSVHIHDIHSHEPKSGNGTRALKHLTGLADKHGVKLNLHAKAYLEDKPKHVGEPEHIRSTPRLQKWYKKHGFQHDDHEEDHKHGSDMTYYPK